MASEHDSTPVAETDGGTAITQVGADTGADASAPPVKRTRKAAVKKAAAPRKRAVKKAAAPAAAAAPEGAPVDAPVEIPPAEAAPAEAVQAVEGATAESEPAAAAPVKKAARKRASRKAASPVVAPQESALLELDAPAADAATDRAPEAPEVAAESTVETTADAVVEPVVEPTVEPAASPFGIVFQPPAAPARRRRRASAPVGQPWLDTEPTDVASAQDAPPVEAEANEPVEPTDEHSVPTAEVTDGTEPEGATAEPAAEPEDEPEDEQDEPEDEQDEPGEEAAADETTSDQPRRRRRRGGKGRRGRGGSSSDDSSDEARTPETSRDDTADGDAEADEPGDDAAADQGADQPGGSSRRRTRRRRRSGSGGGDTDDAPNVVTRVRQPRPERDEVTGVKGSTRLEAKKQRRREGREAGRRRTVITEAEFLARRESVERVMVVRHKDDRTQIGVLEDSVLVEHYISRETNVSMAGNIYLGRVQNVLPSMEAAFVDIGKGRNAVLYAGEVNWDAAGLEHGSAKRIENALGSGQSVLVQVTKDPIGHKGARLTSQISLPGRYLVYVPDSSMTGISRKLPDTERARLKKILKEVVPESAGVIVRTAAEGASEEELRADVERLTRTWEEIQAKVEAAGGATSKSKSKGKAKGGSAPVLLHGEPDLTVRVIRDVFNEDFDSVVVAGEQAWGEVSSYVDSVAPDLAARVTRWTSEEDLFSHYRIDEQLAKAMDRKVWLPSGGSLVIDRTEAMTVIDVNTGKFVGSGGNLEETVTKNNIEAAEEIVRQLRVRDIGGIIVVDFIDMVLEANRDLVVRRLLECLGRDRTKHQVAEVTSLGLVQMTRKRVGSGLIEVFSETCEHCAGRGLIVHTDPVDRSGGSGGSLPGSSSGAGHPGHPEASGPARSSRSRRGRSEPEAAPYAPRNAGPTPAQIAAAAHAAAVKAAEVAVSGEAAPYGDETEHGLLAGAVSPEAGALATHESQDDSVAGETLAAVEAVVAEVLAGGSADAVTEAEVAPDVTPDTPDTTDELEVEPQGRQGRTRAPRRSRGGRGGRSATAEAGAPDPVAAEPAPAPVVPVVPVVEQAPVAPVAQPVSEPVSEPVAQPAAEPARGRRRRGRVVAPAGPPRGAEADGSVAPAAAGSDEGPA